MITSQTKLHINGLFGIIIKPNSRNMDYELDRLILLIYVLRRKKMEKKGIDLIAALETASRSGEFSRREKANLRDAAEILENQQGAIYVEYAFLVAFIAMAAAGGIVLLGNNISTLFNNLAADVEPVATSVSGTITTGTGGVAVTPITNTIVPAA